MSFQVKQAIRAGDRHLWPVTDGRNAAICCLWSFSVPPHQETKLCRVFCSHVNILGNQEASTPHLHLMIKMLKEGWLVKGLGQGNRGPRMRLLWWAEHESFLRWRHLHGQHAAISAKSLSEHMFKRTAKN